MMRQFLTMNPAEHFAALTHRFSGRGWSLRLAIALVIAAVFSGFATYAALTETPPFGNDPDTVIWLLNLDLIILAFLVAIIARRVAKIWSGRRQGIAGSRLHTRLILIFSIMAAAPAILMALFSALFFHFGVQSWFSDRVQTAIMESQAVAESYLEEHQQVIKADLLAMANDLDRQALLYIENKATFEKLVETQSFMRNLSEAMIFDKSGNILMRSGLTFTLTLESVPTYLLEQAEDGEVVITTGANDDRVRAFVKLRNFGDAYLFVGRMVDPTVLSHLDATRDATAEYAALQGRYSSLQITMTMIFVVVALLLMMTAIWFGINLARQLVTPIGAMISASDRVRGGDLTARVPEDEPIEEFDYLARSFNRMTSQIQEQRDELVMANRQLDQRRRFTETVLAGVSAGIIGVDNDGKIAIANSSAGELFGVRPDSLVGKQLQEFLPDAKPLLNKAHERPGKIAQSEIPYQRDDGAHLTLLVRIAIELIGNEEKGAVLTFDDITELQSAQRKAAWADVARRIAHEIKNPLTPIQLSAERLRRKYLKEVQTDPAIFEKCCDTIIKHVGDIGRMVNEFSAFARMPEPILKEEDLKMQVRDTLVLQREAHPDIEFTLIGFDDRAPAMVNCDAQQIRQALTNLLQNAIDSIHGNEPGRDSKINIQFESVQDENYLIAVSDSGPGLPEGEDKDKLAEPYITYKEKGTGLGLAIVKKIMEDHEGRLIIGQPEWIRKTNGWQDLGGATVSMLLPKLKNKAAQKAA
jgi:two-component system nitrogen regulation sensor histidine kinase NtrY